MKCTIIPYDKRLKQLIAEYGTIWYNVSGIQTPLCFLGEKGVLVESLCRNHKRWVKYPSQIKMN